MANGPPSASPEVPATHMRLPRTCSAYRPTPRTRRAGRGVFECRRGTAVRASGPGTHSRRTKPCQHETHVHTLAPHTHCVDTARHLMANSSCTVWLAAAERLLGRLTPQHALGRLTSQHALGRLTSQHALGRLTPQHALWADRDASACIQPACRQPRHPDQHSLAGPSIASLVCKPPCERGSVAFAHKPLARKLHGTTPRRLSCPTHSCRTCSWASSQRPASPSFSPYASSCSPP